MDAAARVGVDVALVHHPRARRRRGAALGPPRLGPGQAVALGRLAGRARRVRAGRLPLDAVLRLRRLLEPRHRHPGRPDRARPAAARPARRSETGMARRTPDGPPPPPVVQRLRLRYAKRGRLRFTSHRDFARAFERALRRADVPMGYSAGFSPHPKISYVGRRADRRGERGRVPRDRPGPRARPATRCAPPWTPRCPTAWTSSRSSRPARARCAERMQASHWHVELPGVDPDALRDGRRRPCSAAPQLQVERLTKDGRREVDVRGAIVVSAGCVPPTADRTACDTGAGSPAGNPCRTTRRHPLPRCGSSPVSPPTHRSWRCAWRRDRSTRQGRSATRWPPTARGGATP